MIIVLADDFAGAAEIAGIAIRFGLVTELRTNVRLGPGTDVLVVDTDTRSCSNREANTKTNHVLSKIRDMKPVWIYKKTDSVLRGHVLDEIVMMMKTFDRKSCVLLPANPGKNRIISNGQYFINGELLNHTAFAYDPEYPAKTADVLQLLGESTEISTFFKKADQRLPDEGITIGEAENSGDVKKWAEKWQEDMLAAGGAEFFESLLNRQGYKAEFQTNSFVIPKDETTLCIWGSSIKKNNQIYNQFKNGGFHILEIPVSDKLFTADSLTNKYTQFGSEWLLKKGRIVITFTSKAQRPEFLSDVTAQIVKNLFKIHKIDELLIEGGSTASAIARKMDWELFVPTDELLSGVVRLKVVNHPELYLTVKPGSYPWPANFI